MFDPTKLSIWINTYNRPKAVNQAIQDWLDSTPDYVPINVISNHSRLKLFKDYGPRVHVHLNNLRPDQSWGYLSRNWNQCFYLGFRDYEWVLCSQDDVYVKPGWIEAIKEHRPFDFYTAPLFDVIFMLNRHSFIKVGWFDERFTVMEYHENDYMRRTYQRLGAKKMSVVDQHGWERHGKPIGFTNDIGLSKFWKHGPDEGYVRPDDHPRAGLKDVHVRKNADFLFQKWGAIVKLNHQELTLRQRIPDIDWYPWFTKWLYEQQGEPYHHGHQQHTIKWLLRYTVLIMKTRWRSLWSH